MNTKLDALLDTLDALNHPLPTDLVAFVQSLPTPGSLPSPWMTWTLIGLVRHLRRQHWVAEIVQTRLNGNTEELAALGAFGHPDGIPQSGSVPGMPEWEYYFHGGGCCISHKVEGDSIDVDFHGESADYFDTYFYENYLASLHNPEPPEQRLRQLHPSTCTITIAIKDLMAAGALSPLEGRDSHPYRLSDNVLSFADRIDAFCTAWKDPDRRFVLAAMIGDWLAAEELAVGNAEVLAVVSTRANAIRELWRKRLSRLLNEPFIGANALQALADLRAPDLENHLLKALRGTPSGTLSSAIEIISQLNDSHWCDRVYSLFRRLDPAGQLPAPYIWTTSLKFLLRHRYKLNELLPLLSKANGIAVGEAVLLSLEHAPQYALPLIRRGLLSEIPMCRTQTAAILALINAPWSKRELLRTLESSDDQELTGDARAALLELGDREAERAVLDWEELNPHENEVGTYIEVNGRTLGPFYSCGEISLKNRATWLAYEMQQLHDRVMQVKHVIPPLG